MDGKEFTETMEALTLEASMIIFAQTLLADIHGYLEAHQLSPFEQDLPHEEPYSCLPSEPRVIEHFGVKIATRILHQPGKGLSDIRGVDMLYEIVGQKYMLVQFKKGDPQTHRVKLDSHQLDTMLQTCPDVCPRRRNPPRRFPARLYGSCGCWYRVDCDRQTWFLHACEVPAVYGGRKSAQCREFEEGLSDLWFRDLFAMCRLGASVSYPSSEYVDALIKEGYAVFEARQEGQWKRAQTHGLASR
jgi:hypothetical protein